MVFATGITAGDVRVRNMTARQTLPEAEDPGMACGAALPAGRRWIQPRDEGPQRFDEAFD